MSLLAISLALILLAAISAAAERWWAVAGAARFRALLGAGCAAGGVAAVRVLTGATGPCQWRMTAAVPGGEWVFGLDALSAVFLLAILAVGAACGWYGVTYMGLENEAAVAQEAPAPRTEIGPRRDAHGATHAGVAALIVALVLVVIARAAVPFLIAWELMALASYALIVVKHTDPAVRRAGLLYLVAAHTSTLALFALFAVWGAGAPDLAFSTLAARAPALPTATAALIFVLALFGFGLKAGVVPLHVWLPEAHAAAPSHISALLSGVVIKMGIYGLLRVVLLIVRIPAWFGWLVLGLGAVSGVLGVVWALAQHDLKRLLAFHSVENIGIILFGIGAGSLGVAYGHPAIAVLGFAGAVLHTLNHALFKSLLFLGAGSVAHATGTRELDQMGGISRHMPRTAAAFLIGAVAIVGLPPLNGFLSEWLVYRAVLVSARSADVTRFAVLSASALALIGALALACFAKVVGVIYLGAPRGTAAGPAVRESPAGLTGPMLALAGACVAIGLVPAGIVPPMLRVGMDLSGGVLATDRAGAIFQFANSATVAITIFTLTVTALILLACLGQALLTRGGRTVRRCETWACGYSAVTSRMQYTSSSFAAPLTGAFHAVAGLRRVRGASAFVTHAVDPVLEGLALPAWRGLRAGASRVRPMPLARRVGRQIVALAVALAALLLYLMLDGRS